MPLLLLGLLLALAPVSTAAADPARTAEAAITAACRELFGADSDVTVALGMISVPDDVAVVASPAPGSRLGAPSRFQLLQGRQPVGYAVATVQVVATHLTVTRAIGRDELLDEAAVTARRAPLPSVPFLRLPGRDEVVGTSARRNLAAGESIVAGTVLERPAIRTGDPVQARLVRGSLEITMRAVASGTGRVGDVIRVRSLGADRAVAARITAPGAVEVLP